MAFALRLLSGDRAGESFSLTEGRVLTIGRDAENDIRLADRKLSRIHCQVEIIGGRCQVADLNSTNGTHVNGTLLEGALWVTPDDEVEVGMTRMRIVELAEVDAGAPADLTDEAEAEP